MTKELIQAMLDGKQLIASVSNGCMIGNYSEAGGIFVMRLEGYCNYRDLNFSLDWKLKPEPKTRPMTAIEVMEHCVDNPKTVIRNTLNNDFFISGGGICSTENMNEWEYNEIEKGDLKFTEWKKFEVVDNE